jgi:uncharacterized protein YecT (DUF1311 family)
LLAGAAGAVALGLALGFWARPALPPGQAAAISQPAGGRTVPVEVGKATPLAQPRPAGKIQVLPPGAEAQAHAQALAAAADSAPPPTDPAGPPEAEGVGPAPLPVPAIATPPPLSRAGRACADAPPGAERMVCSDPELRAEDRELRRAYRRALHSGAAPPRALAADQDDWMAIREDAAQHSRRALEDVYQQRIDELNRIADQGGGPYDDGGGAGFD